MDKFMSKDSKLSNGIIYDKGVVETVSTGIIVFNEKFIIKYVNKLAENFTNLNHSEILGKKFSEIFPDIQFNGDINNYKSLQEIKVNDKVIYYRIYELFTEMNVQYYVCNMFEFTKHNEVYDILKTGKVLSELEEIIEASFDGILVTDGDGNVILVNQSYVRNTGILKDELLGHNMKELINPEWMRNSVAFVVKEQKHPVSMYHTTKHGKNIIVTGTPIFDSNNNIKRIVINSRDISEIYELREELLNTKKREKMYLERLNKQNNDNDSLDNQSVVVSEKMKQLYSLAGKLSNFNTNVLITGESGVGKEELAKFIHSNGIRKDKPFIAVNCGAIPENLLESELFGYEGGAFTGALKTGKEGLFESANTGTLFLDEIGEMPLNLQVKILRALDTRTITRVGSSKLITIDIRIIAATNKNLESKVEKDEFRKDLFYRLNVVKLNIPPLRDRVDDILPLTLSFIKRFNSQYSFNKKATIEVIEEFKNYAWPGNIRQLKNVIENMLVISNNEYLQLNDIPWIKDKSINSKFKIKTINEELSLSESVNAFEKNILLRAKEKHKTTREMAKYLKVDQSTIVRKMKKYNIE